MTTSAPQSVPKPARRRQQGATAPNQDLPHNESRENNGALQGRDEANRRVSHIRSQEHDTKRDSEISNASSQRKRTIGQWQLGKTVGKGGCSTVRLVRHVVTGQLGAAKIISRRMAEQVRAQSLANLAVAQEKSVQDLVAAGKMMPPPPPGLMREISIMKVMDHPNIIKLYDVWENHNELYLIMEYVPGGELFHYVEECRGLEEKESVYIFRQIIAALLYCQRMHIHHRDLKPENILLDRERAQIRLVDFGMAALQPEGEKLTTACGSPHYAAPEVIQSKPYDGAQADVWSCGVILYVMLTGTTPFNYNSERQLHVMYQAIQAADYYMPPELTYHAKDLLRKIFVTRPEKRITADEIWDHPLLHKYDRDFGYDGDLIKKDKWVGPEAKFNTTIKHEREIDKEILRNMRTLWHSVPQQTLVRKLLSPHPNQEKFFYAALTKHKVDQLENYTGDPDSLGYAPSDYQHHQVETGSATSAPQGKQKSQSSYSIMNNEHLRSSSVAERLPSLPSMPSEETLGPEHPLQIPTIQEVPGQNDTRTSRKPKGAGHKRGNSGASALRVEMLKRANQQARQSRSTSTHKDPSAPGARSRSASRNEVHRNSLNSLTSSVCPSSPPVIARPRTSAGHKRNVSFQHPRKTSAHGANASQKNAASTRHIQPSKIEHGSAETDEEIDEEDDEANTEMSSPTRQVQHNAQSRKAKMPRRVVARSKGREDDNDIALITGQVRQVSKELSKACQDAFFRSSIDSTIHTVSSTADANNACDTPPSSISNHIPGAALDTPSGRPLPAVPADTPNTFIARTLENAKMQLVNKSLGGELDPTKINEVLASLEKIMPLVDAERRTTSAPEPKSAADSGVLPIITEEPLPDTLKIGKGGPSKGPRSFTAPGPPHQDARQQKGGPLKHGQDTIRMVQQSPANQAGQSTKSKRDSSMEKEVYSSRPKTSDGSLPQDDKHLQVPNPYDHLLRKKSYDSAIGLKQEEAQQTQTQEPMAKKESSSWFRRWKKGEKASAPSPAQANESGAGAQTQLKDQDDRSGSKTKPSMLKRDKQPPQPLDLLNKAEPPAGPSTNDSEFPMRRVSEGEKQGFSKWFGKLQKKDDPSRATEIKDPQPSPGMDAHASDKAAKPVEADNNGAGNNAAPVSPNADNNAGGSPTQAPIPGQSWFSRFFRMQPQVRITAFDVPRSRARTEIYLLLREFEHHGIADLCYFPQENAITARVEKQNSLGIKPVSFRIELFVVLQNGEKSGLSLGRWTQLRGAASAFERVVDVAERIMGDKAVLVREEDRRRELVEILQ